VWVETGDSSERERERDLEGDMSIVDRGGRQSAREREQGRLLDRLSREAEKEREIWTWWKWALWKKSKEEREEGRR
jgi:hypothetical protein